MRPGMPSRAQDSTAIRAASRCCNMATLVSCISSMCILLMWRLVTKVMPKLILISQAVWTAVKPSWLLGRLPLSFAFLW